MSKDSKTLCEWKKGEIRDDFEKLRELVRKPEFICRKCGRAANNKEVLCKPKEL